MDYAKEANYSSKKLKELSPTTPELPQKIEQIDQPILKLTEDLKEKRTKKISNSQKHTYRGDKNMQ